MKGPKPRTLPVEVSLIDLMWLLGVNKQRISQLEADGIVERTERGRYSIASVPRFIAWQRKRGQGSQAWQEARTELARERARTARLDRLEREGRLVEFDLVELILSAANRTVRDNFL